MSTVKELLKEAKELGIRGRHRMKKEDLINNINLARRMEGQRPVPAPRTVFPHTRRERPTPAPRTNPPSSRGNIHPPQSSTTNEGWINWVKSSILAFSERAFGFLPPSSQLRSEVIMNGLRRVLSTEPVGIAPPLDWRIPDQELEDEQDDVEEEVRELF